MLMEATSLRLFLFTLNEWRYKQDIIIFFNHWSIIAGSSVYNMMETTHFCYTSVSVCYRTQTGFFAEINTHASNNRNNSEMALFKSTISVFTKRLH